MGRVARDFNADPADRAASERTAAVVFMVELLIDDQEKNKNLLSNKWVVKGWIPVERRDGCEKLITTIV